MYIHIYIHNQLNKCVYIHIIWMCIVLGDSISDDTMIYHVIGRRDSIRHPLLEVICETATVLE